MHKKKMAFKLRPYQSEALKNVKQFLATSKKESGIAVLPTGAGKSILVAEIAMLTKEPVLILQPSKELLQQNYEKYTSYGFKASIFSASLKQKEVGHVTFATPQSVKSSINRFKEMGIGLIIVDECHLGSGTQNTIFKIKEGISAKKVIGLTATPVIMDNKMTGSMLKMMNRTRKSFFQDIIHVTQIQELTKENFWTKVDYKIWKVKTSMLVASGSEGFKDESLREYYSQNGLHDRIEKGVNWLKDTHGCKSILVFVPLVEEALALEKKIKGSIAIYGDMNSESREKAINGFKKGKVSVLINVNVLGTGFDYPELSAIIHARPTNSVNLWYQHFGRLVRIHENKPKGFLLDFSGNAEKFGKVEDFTFEKRHKGWGMFSGNKELTSHYQKENINKYLTENVNEVYEVPFGVHKGLPIHKVPQNYLKWVASNQFEPTNNIGAVFKQKATEFLDKAQTVEVEDNNEKIYPIFYKNKWWHEKDCHDVFVAYYHTKEDLGYLTSVYVGDDERIAPDGWI